MNGGVKGLSLGGDVRWGLAAGALLLLLGLIDLLVLAETVRVFALAALCLLALLAWELHRRLVASRSGSAPSSMQQTAGLLELMGSSTDSIIWAKDRHGRMLYINGALERLAGVSMRDVAGKLDAEWNPNPEDAAAFSAADKRVLDSGTADETEESFTGADGVTRHYRTNRSPLRDDNGAVIGSVGVATDVTRQHEEEQRERLLTRELDHRAKNLLAVVQSVITLTSADDVAGFKAAVEGRIQALGRAHSMLAASRWEGADLDRVLSEELAAYRSRDGERVRLAGPQLLLKPSAAQALALVIHELATNAAKYGALSAPEGRLRVSWLVDGARLVLTWEESGGPPLAPPAPQGRVGFGSRLIRGSIERQLGGTLELDWAFPGLTARMEVALERTLDLAAPDARQTANPIAQVAA